MCARVCVCLSVCVCLCPCMRSSVLTPTLPPSPIIYLVKGLLPKQDPLFKLQRPIGPRLKPSFFSVQLWPQGAKPSPCLAWEAGRWITRMGRPKGGGVLRKRTVLQGRQCCCLLEHREAEEEGGRGGEGRGRRHLGCSSQPEAVSLSQRSERPREAATE